MRPGEGPGRAARSVGRLAVPHTPAPTSVGTSVDAISAADPAGCAAPGSTHRWNRSGGLEPSSVHGRGTGRAGLGSLPSHERLRHGYQEPVPVHRPGMPSGRHRVAVDAEGLVAVSRDETVGIGPHLTRPWSRSVKPPFVMEQDEPARREADAESEHPSPDQQIAGPADRIRQSPHVPARRYVPYAKAST